MSQSASDSFRNVTRYLGQDYRFTPTYIRPRDPTTLDIKPKEQQGYYPINSLWSNSSNGNLWALIKYANSPPQAIWVLISSNSLGGILNIAVPLGSSPVYPTAAGQVAFTSSNGTVNITGSANAIDFAVNNQGIRWQTVSQATQPANLSVDNGYICVSGGTGNVSFGLPLTSVIGDTIEVVLSSATSWTITQALGQQIRFGNIQTTSGVGGSIASTAGGDSIRMVCESNGIWNVISSMGVLTII